MDEGGILVGTHKGPAGSTMDGNIGGSEPVQDGERIGRRSLNINVPGQRGHGNKIDVW